MNAARKRTRFPARGKVTTVAANSILYETSPRIALLNELTAQQLRDEWRRLHRGQPPRLSRDLLIRTIAHRMQELACGGLSKATQRKLAVLSKELKLKGAVVVPPAPQPALDCAEWPADHTVSYGHVRYPRSLSILDQNRARHHRGPLVRTPFLWPDPQACFEWPMAVGYGWNAH